MPLTHKQKENLRDAIVDVAGGLSRRLAIRKYNVGGRHLSSAMLSLEEHNGKIEVRLVENENRKQVSRWATNYVNFDKKKNNAKSYTEWELRECTFNVLTGKAAWFKDTVAEFGVPRRSYARFSKKVLSTLGCGNLSLCRAMIDGGLISKKQIQEAINSTSKAAMGRKPYLSRDEEAVAVAYSELKGAHGIPSTRKTFALKLDSMLTDLYGAKARKESSKLAYARNVIRRVNDIEDDRVGQKKRSNLGEIKVRGLSHKRAKQSDPRLAWIMFHKIVRLYRDVIKEESLEASKIVALSEGIPLAVALEGTEYVPKEVIAKKGSERAKMEITSAEAKTSMDALTVIPDDLSDIQPRPSQVWNCDEIGIDPNGKWSKVICTYKWCVTDQIWKIQTGEHAPFWCTLLLFSRADGQCFIPPTVVHQGSNFTQDFQLYLPSDWIVHCTPSGYMDRDGWYKSIRQFIALSGARVTNKQILFFDGHDSHWDADAMDLMSDNHVHGFFLKSGDSSNDQPNDNGFNAKAKAIYNEEKAKWDEQFVSTPFSPAHMNKVISATYARLSITSGQVIKDSFSKTRLVPLRPPTTDEFAGFAAVASLQCGTGKKSKELATTLSETMAPVKIREATTSDEMVIMRASKETTRNLLIRTVAFNAINKSVVVPAQEFKDISQEIANAKKVSLGSCSVPTNTRQNPDSSTGLAVNSELRAKARIVSNNKIAHKQREEEKKKQQLQKQALLTARRQKSFDKVRATVANKGGDLALALSSHSSGDDIKEAFAFCGGKASTLTDGKRATFIAAIVKYHSASFVGGVGPTNGDGGVRPSNGDGGVGLSIGDGGVGPGNGDGSIGPNDGDGDGGAGPTNGHGGPGPIDKCDGKSGRNEQHEEGLEAEEI